MFYNGASYDTPFSKLLDEDSGRYFYKYLSFSNATEKEEREIYFINISSTFGAIRMSAKKAKIIKSSLYDKYHTE